MTPSTIGSMIAKKRKALGYTQQQLADQLHISAQAVSKWENNTGCPEITLLPQLARSLHTSVDALLGYAAPYATAYEDRYKSDSDYYWGLAPSHLCYELMKLKPPTRPYLVLDIGCGEGKDAVFLAKNGYLVSAFDISEAGLEKGQQLAEQNGVYVDFFRANVLDYRPTTNYDIVFSSGVLHYVAPALRGDLLDSLKAHTNETGLHVLNVFVEKPFLPPAPDLEPLEAAVEGWKSGELFTYYHDWYFHRCSEVISDCTSGGIPHQHCKNILIAEKKSPL